MIFIKNYIVSLYRLGFNMLLKIPSMIILTMLEKLCLVNLFKSNNKKSRIWETKHLSTDADRRTDTIFERFIMSLCTCIFRKDERPCNVTMYYILCTMSTTRQGYVYTMYYVYYEARPRNVTMYQARPRNVTMYQARDGRRGLCSPGTSFAPLGESHERGQTQPDFRPVGRFDENSNV